MTGTRIITLICWLVVAIVLIGLVVFLFTGNLFGFRTNFSINRPIFHFGFIEDLTGPFSEAGTYTVDAGNVDSLNVDWVAGEIRITPYDGNEIKITEYARRTLKDNEKLVYDVSGDTLNIRYVDTLLAFNMLTKKLEVFVPESIAGKLDNLYVNSTSAELMMSGFTAKSLMIHETSGEASIANIQADSADIHSVSGEIDITGLNTSSLTMSTVSGDIRLLDVVADTVKSGTTSGEQQFDGLFGSLELESVSGDFDVLCTLDPDVVNFGTTSGDIRMTIPGNTDLIVSYSTVSGDFASDVPVITGGGSAAYRFSSVSGDIRITKAA